MPSISDSGELYKMQPQGYWFLVGPERQLLNKLTRVAILTNNSRRMLRFAQHRCVGR
jgi:hypothetical protein